MIWIIGIALVAVLWVMGNKNAKKRTEKINAQLPVLAQMIQGGVQGTGVAGTYQGAPVQASIVTREYRDSEGGTTAEYFWSTRVQTNPAAAEWKVSLKGHGIAGAVGLGKKDIQVQTKDDSLKAWLEGAGVLNYAGQIPPVAEGKAELFCQGGWAGIILKIKDPGDLPTPDLFQNLVQTAVGLAQFAVAKQ